MRGKGVEMPRRESELAAARRVAGDPQGQEGWEGVLGEAWVKDPGSSCPN